MPDVTIYDVAQRAGVSISTVSRVLNSPERVSEATRLRVLTTIAQLHFTPKAEATARARKGIKRIGILSPFFTFHSFVDRLRGVVTALMDTPYELVTYYVDSCARRDSYLVSLPITHRLDGLIILALPFDQAAAQRLLEHKIETVLIEAPQQGFSGVAINDEAGGRLAAEYLIGKGHARLGFVGDSDVPEYAIPTSDWRLRGYRSRIGELGKALRDEHIGLAPHGMEQAHAQAARILRLSDPPTAIFAASDIQAIGVLKAAREHGLAVPQDLAVLGFDDIELASYAGLTSIRQHLTESGRIAVDLLLARISDPNRPVQHVTLPLTLISRETA